MKVAINVSKNEIIVSSYAAVYARHLAAKRAFESSFNFACERKRTWHEHMHSMVGGDRSEKET